MTPLDAVKVPPEEGGAGRGITWDTDSRPYRFEQTRKMSRTRFQGVSVKKNAAEKCHIRDKMGHGLETLPFRIDPKNVTHPISRCFGNKMPRKSVALEIIWESDSRPYRFEETRKVLHPDFHIFR